MSRKRKKRERKPPPRQPEAASLSEEQARTIAAIAEQRARRDAAIAQLHAELDERGRAGFATLQRVAAEKSVYWLLLGDGAADDKLRTDLFALSAKALSEAVKAGRHLAKDDYARLLEAQERNASARSAFAAARASKKVVN